MGKRKGKVISLDEHRPDRLKVSEEGQPSPDVKPVKVTITGNNETSQIIAQRPVEEEPVYAFPAVSRCTRCGSPNTKAYKTRGRVQYRRCLSAVCRWTFSVRSERV